MSLDDDHIEKKFRIKILYLIFYVHLFLKKVIKFGLIM